MNEYASPIVNYLSYGLVLFNLDPTNQIMKLTQMTKWYSRLRFLDVKFGSILGSYFKSYGEKYDPRSKISLCEMEKSTQGYKGNFTRYHIPLHMFESEYISVSIYLACWALYLSGKLVLGKARKDGKISKLSCYFVDITQKLFLVSFNMTIVDVVFYGLRTLFHVDGISIIHKAIAILVWILVLLQVCFIWNHGLELIRAEKERKITAAMQEEESQQNAQEVHLQVKDLAEASNS